jgi:hypothetical protein
VTQFDEHKVVSGSADSTIKLWDINRGNCTATLTQANGGKFMLRLFYGKKSS